MENNVEEQDERTTTQQLRAAHSERLLKAAQAEVVDKDELKLLNTVTQGLSALNAARRIDVQERSWGLEVAEAFKADKERFAHMIGIVTAGTPIHKALPVPQN